MDEARALEALTSILARPEFNPQPAFDPWGAFWSAVWDLLVDLLGWFFRPIGQAIEGQLDWFGLALVALAVLVLGAGIWFVVRAVRLNMVSDAAALSRAQALRRARADRLWREAHDLAAAGDLPGAVRALYLSALYALEERDVLPVQEALTNREHADRLARLHPDASPVFVQVVGQYDRLRYGGEAIDRTAYEALRELVGRARAATTTATTA
ncbi:MAG TPA: DUF4129 domain-containing protein [Chloroflexota bacterium]|nr:DUF4129 domain-containing protein [Chloroflexota bacterium]